MSGKIIARMFGGLGNQMFIYANARSISIRNNLPLIIDTKSGFKNDPYKRFWALDNFNIQYERANLLQTFNFPSGRIVRKLLRKYSNYISPIEYISEEDFEKFDPNIKYIKVTRPTWIEGYWQSPSYFEDLDEVIRNDFQPSAPLSSEAQKVLVKIQNTNSVCLHARRLRNELVGEQNAKIKTLDISYYNKAIDMVGNEIARPHFFCFADNPVWLEQNLRIPFPTSFITFNQGRDDKSHEDLILMMHCKHHIISNSTFAWWAAWLGSNEGGLIITPNLAFWDSKSIIPSHRWINI